MFSQNMELVLTAIQSFSWTHNGISENVKSGTGSDLPQPLTRGNTWFSSTQPPIPKILELIERHKDFLELNAHQVKAFKGIKRSYWLQYRRRFRQSLLHGKALHTAITTGKRQQDIPNLSRALEQDRLIISQILGHLINKLDALLSSEQKQCLLTFSSGTTSAQLSLQ